GPQRGGGGAARGVRRDELRAGRGGVRGLSVPGGADDDAVPGVAGFAPATPDGAGCADRAGDAGAGERGGGVEHLGGGGVAAEGSSGVDRDRGDHPADGDAGGGG